MAMYYLLKPVPETNLLLASSSAWGTIIGSFFVRLGKKQNIMGALYQGLIVTGILLLLVVLGTRVAFAAAMCGMIGLIWIFWSKKGYDPAEFTWALTVATKTAGQVPHSKVASQALLLIPTFILIGYLAYYAGLTKALFEAAKPFWRD